MIFKISIINPPVAPPGIDPDVIGGLFALLPLLLLLFPFSPFLPLVRAPDPARITSTPPV